MTGCSICNFFKEVPNATSFELQVLQTIFRRLFEDTKITTKFLKRHICNLFCIEINMLFAIFNNKEKGSFKIRPNHTRLKKMNAVSWKVFSSINAMNVVTQNYPKKWLFSRNSCS